MMDNKGQAIFFGMMIGVMVFIALTQMITPIKDSITEAREVGNLDCTNSSISIGTKATCVIVDWTLPYYVGGALAAAIGGMGVLGLKKLVKNE